MDFLGLVLKYPVGRMLTVQERAHHLHQKQRLNLEPRYQLSVIKMNSTFLESVDKWFAWKGMISAFALAVLAIFVGGVMFISIAWMMEAFASTTASSESSFWILNSAGMAVVGVIVGSGAIWLLRKESFRFTHYPIRFNRKSQTVHVFLPDGTVLSVPWEKIFFTLGHLALWNEWEIRGYILDPDEKILETFSLSYLGTLNAKDIAPEKKDYSSQDFVRAHWEFVRRYMEDGPQDLSSQVQFCMPVAVQRESFRVGTERVFANFSGIPSLIYWLVSPFCLIVSCFRWFAMRTSKVPEWPADIEAGCVVEPNDPYAIEGAPDGERVAVFPSAALVTGGRFCTSSEPATVVRKPTSEV
jgi:hypothetical protein